LRQGKIYQENTDGISIFLNEMVKIRQQFHLRFFFDFFSMESQHWFKKWIGADLALSHFLDQ